MGGGRRHRTSHSHLHTLRFRAVCRSWRSSTPLPPVIPSIRVPPLRGRLFSLKELAVYSIRPATGSSSTPLLLRAQTSESGNAILKALNSPASDAGDRIALDLREFRVDEEWCDYCLDPVFASNNVVDYPSQVAVSSSFREMGDGFMVVALTPDHMLAFWKVGDDKWTILQDVTPNHCWFDSVVYANDKFYALGSSGLVLTIDTTTNPVLIKTVAEGKWNGGGFPDVFRYNVLVITSCGDLLWVYKVEDIKLGVLRFEVLKLDEEGEEWVELGGDELKERVIFLGHYYYYGNRSPSSSSFAFSVMAKDFPEYYANCIYVHGRKFTRYLRKGFDCFDYGI
ncbi:hypothetical protein Tsubulata_041813, partial [Turnera subulata]